MKTRKTSASRGVALIETLAASVVLILGLMGAMAMIRETNRANRRTLTATQAQTLGELTLENIVSMGCTRAPACGNIAALDGTRSTVWQTAAGAVLTSKPAASVVAREYELAVDVDGSVQPGLNENGSVGVPAVDRSLRGQGPGDLVNVRVSVSWVEPARTGRQVVVLQTRMAP
ncbi:pilus assembly protein [Corallococcus sp. AS-1-6]|uniref:type IV pilus modification PilV family protein n=1 Tax=Corallococcus TaxID=83461 RepID=UPI001CBF4706|nr:pilus assembly protein [Corallococcus sp. AS-1-6]MBZ4373299.1 pilus assembly protein [Corallococcus sp. AS-1-6]